MKVRWGSKSRYWIEMYDPYQKRYVAFKAKEAPMWVRRMALREEEKTKFASVKCVEAGGLCFPHMHEIDPFFEEGGLPNPAFKDAMRMQKAGKYVDIPEEKIYPYVYFDSDHAWYGGVIVPRFMRPKECRVFRQPRLYSGDDIDSQLAQHIRLRGYQSQAVLSSTEKGHGVIQAPCGAGKTAIGVGIISMIKKKTLVLVHTGDLLSQWAERIEEWTPNVSVGMKGLGKDIDGDVVVATVQTLSRMKWSELYEWSKQFGVCILDEAHHGPARTYIEVMSAIPSKYRFALTATPKRKDGLHPFIHMLFGETVWSIDHSSLESMGLISIPTAYRVPTTFDSHLSSSMYTKVISEMLDHDGRNQMILDLVEKCYKEGRSVLVLSDRVGHCEVLSECLSYSNIEAPALVGKMKSADRNNVIDRARKGDIRVVIATSLADEGLDIRRLDTLVMCCPSSSMGKVEQRVGRIMRPHNQKKKPVVFDIRDSWKPLYGGARKRDALYRKLNIESASLMVHYEERYNYSE